LLTWQRCKLQDAAGVSDVPKAEIINPPNLLRRKVSGSGPISQEMLTRAKAAVENLTAQFSELLKKDIEKVSALHAEGLADPARRLDIVKAIFEVMHDLRGQAGTFDYPLVTRVGSSLCRFVENLEACDDRCYEVIGVHVEALNAILRHAVRGDGGPLGQEIADGLERAVKKILS
jgi:hypothetical protein